MSLQVESSSFLYPLDSTPPHDDLLSNDADSEGSEEDDDLYEGPRPAEMGEGLGEGSFGDEEQVEVAGDQFTWRIDHHKGDHKFHGTFLIIINLPVRGSLRSKTDNAISTAVQQDYFESIL